MEMKPLPDVAGQQSKTVTNSLSALKFVGMSHIQMPVRIEERILPAQVAAQVNLRAYTSRGIHMSRLYHHLSESLTSQSLSWSQLEQIAVDFISSQEGISDQAKIHVGLQWPLRRRALKSELQGWRLYPVEMEVQAGPLGTIRRLAVEVLYSSTCPASTALSRELWKDSFQAQFGDTTFDAKSVTNWMDSFEGMPATPHAQRSRARVQIEFQKEDSLTPEDFINTLENVLSTPVQTAVKRVDEQEFARLNGENTMFCEDAARRVQFWLDSLSYVQNYHGYFEHQESLHAHNAVAEIEKKNS